MHLYPWILENKEFLKIMYSLVITLICIVIVFRADKLFRLSTHQGIRYFRNAFFFYGLGFVLRYMLGLLISLEVLDSIYLPFTNLVFEFFLIMAGFFLLYSLIWRKLDITEATSSLFNSKISIFYLMSLIIVISDYMWNIFFFMFISQILLFLIASMIALANYVRKGKQHKFLKFYLAAMVLSLAAWVLNFFAALSLAWNPAILMSVYILNVVIFLLFLYGVVKVTK